MRASLRALYFTCAFCIAWTSTPANAEWLFDADVGLAYDDNVNRAFAASDIRADSSIALSAAGGWFMALSGSDGLTLTADARGERFDRFDGLGFVSLGGTALYRHKLGLGFAAPWLLFSASAAHDNYRSDIRDSSRVQLRAELGKRFTEAFDAAFGARAERRYARNEEAVVPGISGKVFDLRARSIYARAGYAVNDRLLLGLDVSARRGDVVATTRRDFQIFVVSDAIAPDPTFGPDFFAYRLRGTTDAAKLTASWALDDRSSVNFAYVDERTDAAGGVVYRSHAASLVFAWHY
jgi:hypothetical protein